MIKKEKGDEAAMQHKQAEEAAKRVKGKGKGKGKLSRTYKVMDVDDLHCSKNMSERTLLQKPENLEEESTEPILFKCALDTSSCAEGEHGEFE